MSPLKKLELKIHIISETTSRKRYSSQHPEYSIKKKIQCSRTLTPIFAHLLHENSSNSPTCLVISLSN